MVESVQRRFTKYLNGMSERSYAERLHALNLDSLEVRRIRADLIVAYKILFGQLNVDKELYFERNKYTATRSHVHKVTIPFAHSDIRKNFYTIRTAKIWNELPTEKVDFSCLKHFISTVSSLDFKQYCTQCI